MTINTQFLLFVASFLWFGYQVKIHFFPNNHSKIYIFPNGNIKKRLPFQTALIYHYHHFSIGQTHRFCLYVTIIVNKLLTI